MRFRLQRFRRRRSEQFRRRKTRKARERLNAARCRRDEVSSSVAIWVREGNERILGVRKALYRNAAMYGPSFLTLFQVNSFRHDSSFCATIARVLLSFFVYITLFYSFTRSLLRARRHD